MNDQIDKTCLYTYKGLIEKTELEWSNTYPETDFSINFQSRLDAKVKLPISLIENKKIFEVSLN